MIDNPNVRHKPHIKLRHIMVSEGNYLTLKKLGSAGDSFNDVVTEILNKIGILQSESRVATQAHIAISAVATDQGGQNIYE